jgi:hypothetical protein
MNNLNFNIDKKKLITWGAIALGGYLLYKYFKGNPTAIFKSGFPYSPDNSGNINTSTFNSKKGADEIFAAMDGYGTDESAIVGVFNKVKNNTDFDELVRDFGTRTISSGNLNVFQGDFTGDLASCLKNELDSDWINSINSALQRNGVTKTI